MTHPARRLIASSLWRERYRIAVGTALLSSLALAQFPSGAGAVRVALAASLTICACAPLTALGRLPPRSISWLPVSRRQIWLVWIVLGVALPVGMLAVAASAAIFVSPYAHATSFVTWPFVAWSAALNAAAGAITFDILSLFWLTVDQRSGRSTATRGWAVAALLLTAVAWPLVMRARLPLSWHDAGAAPFAVLALGLLAGVRILRYSPANLVPTAAANASPQTSPATSGRPSSSERSRRSALPGGVIDLVLFQVGWSVFLVAGVLLAARFIPGPQGAVTVWFISGDWLTSRLRRLRPLPVSGALLAGLYTGLPILWWLMAVVLQRTFEPWIGRPLEQVDLGAPALVCVTLAAITVGRSCVLRWGKPLYGSVDTIRFASLIAVAAINAVGHRVVHKYPADSGVVMALSLVALVFAFVIDRRAIERRSDLYRLVTPRQPVTAA
jgi:hypothetical protein